MSDIPLIVLVGDEGERALAHTEAEAVLAAFPVIRHHVVKWTRMFQRRGRLLLIDPQMIEEVEAYLYRGQA